MSGDMIAATGRSATMIAIEIKTIHAQAMSTLLAAAVEIGKRLHEAKALVPRGEWGDYIANEVGYSQSQCNNYMRLATEYADTKSQSIGKLSPTAALALLALPAGEREEFADAHDAAGLSVSELKKQIAEHKARADDAEAQAAAQQQLLLLATEENGALKQRLDGIDADYKAQLDTVDRENDSLREQLAAVSARPAEISTEQAEQFRAEGRAEAEAKAAEAQKRTQSELDALAESSQKELGDRDRAIADLKAQLAEAQRTADVKAASADPEFLKFGAILEEAGSSLNRLVGMWLKAKTGNPRLAAAMHRALTAQAEGLMKQIGS